jgi:hypothetical protein
MGCSFRPDWVAGFLRIRWQLCTGLGGRNHRNTHLNYYVDGTVVTARYAVQSNSTQQAGVDRIIGWEIVELKAGKIGATRGPVWERTDAQTARYLEWQRTQQATK